MRGVSLIVANRSRRLSKPSTGHASLATDETDCNPRQLMVAAKQRGIEPVNKNARFDGNRKKPTPSYAGKSPARVRKIAQHRPVNRRAFRLAWVWVLYRSRHLRRRPLSDWRSPHPCRGHPRARHAARDISVMRRRPPRDLRRRRRYVLAIGREDPDRRYRHAGIEPAAV